METQNVSAQVYFKQLPSDPAAGQFGCNQTGDVLSTCVNDLNSDAQIENAFQSQLGLSEYYKSPGVFMAVKRDYMDQTMGTPPPGTSAPGGTSGPILQEPVTGSVQLAPKPVSSKSSFGSSSTSYSNFMWAGLIIVIAFILFYLIVIKN